MASIGHIAVGMAAARVSSEGAVPRWSAMTAWSALSLLPDADVIGFTLGVEYGDPWGHRGATHSLAFAAVLAAALGLARRIQTLHQGGHGGREDRAYKFYPPCPQCPPWWRIWAIATAVIVSHGLLDTLTDGGLGCALLWPFDLTRYFAPWLPIPVAPLGLYFFSPFGLLVAHTELVVFAPVVAFALRPGRRTWLVLLPVWALAASLLASSGDTIRDAALGVIVRAIGPPPLLRWDYSRSGGNGYFRVRAVCFSQGKVSTLLRQWAAT